MSTAKAKTKLQACVEFCDNASGVARMECEIACFPDQENDTDIWNHGKHLARHKYALSGREATIFAFAFFLGERRKEYEF